MAAVMAALEDEEELFGFDLSGCGDCASSEEEEEEDGYSFASDGAEFRRRVSSAAMAVSGPQGWSVVDGALDEAVALRLRHCAAAATCGSHRFHYDGVSYAKPGIFELDMDDVGVGEKCESYLSSTLRELADGVVAALPASCAIDATARVAVKLQRNEGGAFPCHYDNPGAPNKRALTAVLYLGCDGDDDAPISHDDGGELVLSPFLKRQAKIRPLLNRLVFFKSDTVLHAVSRWTRPAPRYVVSFWFDSDSVNLPGDLELTRDALSFSSYDEAADFFASSPLQRCLSRAVYDEDYVTSIKETIQGGDSEGPMLQGHRRVVDDTNRQLRPLVLELRQRRGALQAMRGPILK